MGTLPNQFSYDSHEPQGCFNILGIFGKPIFWFPKTKHDATNVQMAKSAATALAGANKPFVGMF